MRKGSWLVEKEYPSECRIVILGDVGVGKSSLAIRLVIDDVMYDCDPASEEWYRKSAEIDGTDTVLDVWDMAGHEEFASLVERWIREADGFLLVYSITSLQSFEYLTNFYETILRIKKSDKFPIVIAGNKCDLRPEVPKETGKALADKWGCPFFETSAKELINNRDCFYELVREIRKHDELIVLSRSEVQRPAGAATCCRIL